MNCPACGSDNPESALYCGMCKEVFRREKPKPAPPPKAAAPPPKKLPPPKLKPLERGDLVGSYSIVKKLGEGGFGIVYLTYLEEADRYLALKTFRDQLMLDESARRLFRTEAQTWVDLEKHPFVVRAHLVEEFNHRLYIAMEYIEPDADGNSLESVLVRRQPSLAESLRWMIVGSPGTELEFAL